MPDSMRARRTKRKPTAPCSGCPFGWSEKERQSERLACIEQATGDVIWDRDMETGTVWWNGRAWDVLGTAVAQAEFDPEWWHALVHDEDRERFLRLVRRFIEGEVESWSAQIRMRVADGSYRFFWSRGCAIRKQGPRVTRFVGILTDVTEARAAQRARDQFFNLSMDPMCIGNSNPGGFIRVNPAWEKALGFSKEEMLKMSFVEIVHPDDRVLALAELEKRWGGTPTIGIELRFRCKDGSYRWFLSSAATDEPGGLVYLVAKDITLRKAAEAELQRAKEAAEAAARAKGQFLANMSHEIRTPMNAVIGMLGLLLDTPLTAEQRRFSEVAASSSRALLSLIDDILDFSKIEARKLVLEQVDFDLRALVDGTIDMLTVETKRKGLALSCEIAPEAPRFVHGDPTRLRQVLTNLASNAIKFTARGRVSLRVAVEEPSGSSVRLRFTVEDTGIGIPPADLARVFTPFEQADGSTTRTHGGTGLGLSISHQLVQLMGGHIGVESVVEQGSTFWFTVVLGRSAAASAPKNADERRGHAPAIDRSLARILLVEDNAVNREVALAILGKLGLRADAVTNGQEAVSAVEATPYDLLLMDCEMPVMDGYQATRRIRAWEKAAGKPAMPIIALTAHAMAGDRAKTYEAGMSDYLAKPIDGSLLGATLERWLGGRSFDEPSLLKRLMGDRQLAGVIVAAFLSRAPEQLRLLASRVAEGDAAGAHMEAHSLKGAAATISAVELADSAKAVEEATKLGDLGRAAQLLPEIAKQYQHLVGVLEDSGWSKRRVECAP